MSIIAALIELLFIALPVLLFAWLNTTKPQEEN